MPAGSRDLCRDARGAVSRLAAGGAALDRETLGVPVIAVGVPTVTDAATLAMDLFRSMDRQPDEAQLRKAARGMLVTSGDIDRQIREVSRLLAFGINHALQPDLSLQDLQDLTF